MCEQTDEAPETKKDNAPPPKELNEAESGDIAP